MTAAAFRRSRRRPVLAAILAMVVYVSGNLWLTTVGDGVRIDLTENRIFTLSPTTVSVIDDVVEPIRVQFFYSSALSEAAPGIAAFGSRVRGLLGAYQRLSDGAIIVEEYDPAPFSEEEDRALAFGLTGLPGGPEGDPVYFGLAAYNSVDDRVVIPFLQPDRESELEYDLTSAIRALADPEQPSIGVVSTLPVLGSPPGDPFIQAPTGPWHVFTLLNDAYDLQPLDLSGGSVDGAVDLLILVHPRDLPPASQYAIDQYLMRGRPALVFVDPVSETELAQRPPQERFAPAFSDLGPFGASWGVSMDPEHAVADRSAALQVAVRGRPGEQVPFVGWLGYGAPAMSPDDPITARLDRLHFAAAGHLTADPAATTALAPLVRSDPQAMRIAAGALGMHPDPRALLSAYEPGDEALILAARVTGPAPSAFPDGPPGNLVADGLAPVEQFGQTAAPLDIVVVADTDFLSDRFWVTPRTMGGERVGVPFADNGDFVLNAVESLLDAVDLSGLRGRAVTQRPFTRIAALQADARGRFLATEFALREELERAQAALQSARAPVQGDGEAADTEAETLEAVRARLLSVRRDLRDVQRQLREEVTRLEDRLRLANILAMPTLVALTAIGVAGLGVIRRRRRAIADQHP